MFKIILYSHYNKESVSQLVKTDFFMIFLDFLSGKGFHTGDSQPHHLFVRLTHILESSERSYPYHVVIFVVFPHITSISVQNSC